MRSDLTAAASLTAILALAATAATAAVPEPVINGVVVQDVTQPFAFDQAGWDVESEPWLFEDHYRGTVQTKVIRAPDSTYDFYFHITVSSGAISSFSSMWQTAASYTVAYHGTDHPFRFESDATEPASAGPAPGSFVSNAVGVSAYWLTPFQGDARFAGALHEGILLFDTDARAYAANTTYMLADRADFFRGGWSGDSPLFNTFGPAAIPEPQTYALMLTGIGLLAFVQARRRSGRKPAR